MGLPRITRVFGAVNIGSFRISAMIMGLSETGEMIVLGSGHRASQGIKRGYVTDMAAATYAIRDAVERAEKNAGTSVSSVWIGCAGAGLASQVAKVEIDIGGRRIEEEDIELLLVTARDSIEPDGRMVLHAQPAHYTLDGAHGVANPKGLHAEQLGVDVHVMLADGAPVRNLIEAVQNAHLDVEAVVAAPIAAGYSCLTHEERELGTALIEIGGEVTNVSLYAGGMLLGLAAIPYGSADITDAIASSFGIRRFQAERLKCVAGSAIASPTDHREMVPVNGPDDGSVQPAARGADDRNRIPRAELVSVVTEQLAKLTGEIARSLKAMGFSGSSGSQVVLTGGGAELAGIAEFTQSALGRPVRIGKPPALRGLPEAHSTAGFATLAGLCLYAADDPVDIRSVGPSYQPTMRYSGLGLVNRVVRAVREYF
ncbi:cell division protein FtsA [Pelagerythrobacter marinus]|jgi:cell division protein FtsA|uniref:Cell division protein FtsA n=1 Tax=Pelagerythrobacter marinus TaxID=538382 RepID=A0ABW9UY91_9SPHN|nr:cell division protein FtsA [Pelagerythrobacter marinus]MEC9066893.1 cell division protein FtsA [Pseudomonadota bacterium]MXO69143.1 cell division protein FtsA [Pelagerythrobacter marinus]USA40006.1 cell division protein FtsA [Pelagerythrobacter marinus]WPZ05873.1 cell division protein FtsA [Pelagerythrobacter marinus]